MAWAHHHSIRAKVTNSCNDPEHYIPPGTLTISVSFPCCLCVYAAFLHKACDNRKSQSICAHSQLARGYESDLIMLLHYYLMPWTLLENRFVIACSHTVFIMIWHAVMPTEIQRPIAICTWFRKQQVILWCRWDCLDSEKMKLHSNTEHDISCECGVVDMHCAWVKPLSPFCVLTVIRWGKCDKAGGCGRLLWHFSAVSLVCVSSKGFSWCILSTRMRQSTPAR